jgi:uncharacterized membrane protein
MKELDQVPRFEPRWHVAIMIILLAVLLALTPNRISLFPIWVPVVIGIVVLIPVSAVGLSAAKAQWLRIERITTLLFCVVASSGTVLNLDNVIREMASRSTEISGTQLFTTSIGVWVANVVVFALLYWQLDRGGPESWVNQTVARPDWLFPQDEAAPEVVPPGWKPMILDYLYLSFTTATAFSTTDVMPLTARAKMLMMIESAIALVTVVVVAARAINIFGS